MKVSIMQPIFLPWVGYFKMIKESDLFIFLDDVQFEKKSYQKRNKILLNRNEKMITVPVLTKNKFTQNINEVFIDNKRDWKIEQIETLRHNYSKHQYYEENISYIKKTFNKDFEKLADLDIELIKSITKYLSIDTKFELSSNFKINERKEKKLIKILKTVGATEYLTPMRSKDYLGEGKIFRENNIKLNYFNYTCKKYEQKNSDKFVSHLSIIDLLFNKGKKSAI
tara:strand:+ start:1001 stop:1675 length:675 start_codon:yes stop_codon:yes gene_type:complete